MKTITYNPETHVLVPREPSQGMIDAMPPVEEIGYWAMYEAAIAAAPQPEQVESEPVPDFRGYAALGTGQYLLNACPATEDLPAELVISIATEEEKAGRVIGDLKDVEPGTEIDPSSMAVRLAFFSVSGLDALEQQLRILREESFPNTTPQPDRVAELEQLRQRVTEKDEVIAEAGEMLAMRDRQLAAIKADNATAWAQAHRLALELECLLLDAKDNATVSKWWDSGMEALSEYQELQPGAAESAEAWAKMRKEMK